MKKEDKIRMLKEFRRNSRSKLTDISKKTNIPVTTLFERMKTLNEYFIKNTTLIDFSKLDYPLMIMYIIKISDEMKERFKKDIEKNPNLNNMHRISGKYNYLIESYFKTLKEANEFYEFLNKYSDSIIEHQIINEIKKEEFFT